MTNRLENDSDNVSGSVAIKQQLPGEDYATKRTITPNIVLSGNAEAPEISGTIGYQEEKRYGTAEECVITLHAARASESLWKDTAATMELSTLSAETLQNLRSQLSGAIATAIVRPLIQVLSAEDAAFLFYEMSDEDVQTIRQAAESAVEIE